MIEEIKLKIDDKGIEKEFVIREMSALKHEDWLFKLMLCLGDKIGQASITELLLNLKFEDIKPLKDELWDCVYIINGNGIPMKATEPQIDDVKTKIQLTIAAFELHIKPLTEGLSISLGQDQQ